MTNSVLIEAPSRLHFGMFSFGERPTRHPAEPSAGCPRQFGGVGLMVDRPRLRMTIQAAPSFSCVGLHADRCRETCRRVAELWLEGQLPHCRISVESAPGEHTGLGLGTQLTLAAAVGLIKFCRLPDPPSAHQVAIQLGRAQRSSVGTHGFMHGGLIVDAGHAAGEPIGTLAHRAELPHAWRVLLITPRTSSGLSGGKESEAFRVLPPVPPQVTGELTTEVLLEMLPAAWNGDFDAFSRSVYRFGRTAGGCFSSIQGGPFAQDAAELIKRLRDCGVYGVGQSSWGPTVFAFTQSETAADRLRRELAQTPDVKSCEILVARPDNHGAVVAFDNKST